MISRTDEDFEMLLERIQDTWRWHHHYTGIYADGKEYKTGNPESIPGGDNLLGIYDGSVTLEHLKDDLAPITPGA